MRSGGQASADDQVEAERQQRQEQEQAAVSARDGLKREEGDGDEQVAPSATLQIGVDEGETEGDPLDRREVELRQAREARRREGEDHAGDEGAGGRDPELAREQERPGSRQDAGQQDHDVQGEHRVVGRQQERRAEHGAPEEMLGVRERPRLGVEDVRVEEPQRLVQQRVDVPGQRPQEEPGVGRERQRARARIQAERERQDGRQGNEHEDDRDDPARIACSFLAQARAASRLLLTTQSGRSAVRASVFDRAAAAPRQ